MSHTLHGVGNGFLVENPPVFQGYIQTEALAHQALENLQLYLAHKLDMNLPAIQQQPQLGVLFLQLAQLGQHHRRVTAFGQAHPVGHHRFQHRRQGVRLRPQGKSRPGLRQSRHRRQGTCSHFLSRGELVPGIEADLGDFFLFFFPFLIFIRQHAPPFQAAAGDLQPGQPVALRVPGNLVHPGGKAFPIFHLGCIAVQNGQKMLHPC